MDLLSPDGPSTINFERSKFNPRAMAKQDAGEKSFATLKPSGRQESTDIISPVTSPVHLGDQITGEMSILSPTCHDVTKSQEKDISEYDNVSTIRRDIQKKIKIMNTNQMTGDNKSKVSAK